MGRIKTKEKTRKIQLKIRGSKKEILRILKIRRWKNLGFSLGEAC